MNAGYKKQNIMTESWETRNSREQKLENKETRKLGTDEKTNRPTAWREHPAQREQLETQLGLIRAG